MSRRITTVAERIACLLAIPVLMAGLAGPVQAQGTMDMSWNGCFGTAGGPGGVPAVNKDWGSAFDNYFLMLSATGVDEPSGEMTFSHDIRMVIGPNVPDAFRFDATGCMTNNFSAINYISLGALNCGGLRNGGDVPITDFQYDGGTGNAAVRMATAYPAGRDADPGVTYLLWQLAFGMGAAGSSCGGETNMLCFVYVSGEYFVGPTSTSVTKQTLTPGTQPWATWQDPSNNQPCPGVPAESATWGRVKNLYR